MSVLDTRWIALLPIAIGMTGSPLALADDLSWGFEGNLLPSDPQSGLIVGDPCDPPCQESLVDGVFRVSFPASVSSQLTNYSRTVSVPPQEPPPTLWVEWRFRSNHAIPTNSYSCDGSVTARFRRVWEPVWLYGDAALSYGLDDVLLDLPLEEFHAVRFESLDGITYRYSVNGRVFSVYTDNENYSQFSYVQFMTRGGCNGDWIPNKYNEWDFVRYGTIGFGERIVETNPLAGFLRPDVHGNLDRFTVTYDSPNYAYIDDIAVSVTCATAPNCPEAPQVIATKRLDNGPPDVLEIVLDRPLPANARTVFTFTDVDPGNPTEPTINIVSYTFQLGDVDADGDWDLRDFASAQNCFQCGACLSDPELRWMRCRAFDFVTENELVHIKLDDIATFIGILTGPET